MQYICVIVLCTLNYADVYTYQYKVKNVNLKKKIDFYILYALA